MPTAIVNKVAKTLGKKEAERLWEKAKSLAIKNYPKVKENSTDWYRIVMGIYMRMTRYKKKEEGIMYSNLLSKLYNESLKNIFWGL
jgi:hypothetical protein